MRKILISVILALVLAACAVPETGGKDIQNGNNIARITEFTNGVGIIGWRVVDDLGNVCYYNPDGGVACDFK